jgi:hypothetical protein
MGSRTLPTECHHGNIVDWGDFGQHQNGCPDGCTWQTCPDLPICDQCEAEGQVAADHLLRQQRLAELCDRLWDDAYPDDPYLLGSLRAEMVRLGYEIPPEDPALKGTAEHA